MSRQWIIICKQKLEDLGLITLIKKGGGRKSNLYRCNREAIEKLSTQRLSGKASIPQQSSEMTAAVKSPDPNLPSNRSYNQPTAEEEVIETMTDIPHTQIVENLIVEGMRFSPLSQTTALKAGLEPEEARAVFERFRVYVDERSDWSGADGPITNEEALWQAWVRNAAAEKKAHLDDERISEAINAAR